MKNLLELLFGFFILGVVDGEGEGEGAGEGAGAEEGEGAGAGEGEGSGEDEGEGTGEDEGEGDDGSDIEAAAAQAAREVKEANERAVRAEAALEAARRAAAPALSDEQRMAAEEDARLRDPKTTDLERWQIQSNRTLRENKRTSMTALAQAQDLNDRTAFSTLAVKKPELYNRYAERVEAEINRMRGAGQSPPPREALMTYMIGQDAMNGKLQPKKKAAGSEINRGKSPGARSDVAAKGRLTESQAREKRLDGVQI